MPSLKSQLQQIIKDRNGGIFTLNELEAYCHKVPCKLASAERKLRPSESPNIERVMKKNYILGYKYVVQNQDQTSRQALQPDNPQTRSNALPVQFSLFTRNIGYPNQPFSETPQGIG